MPDIGDMTPEEHQSFLDAQREEFDMDERMLNEFHSKRNVVHRTVAEPEMIGTQNSTVVEFWRERALRRKLTTVTCTEVDGVLTVDWPEGQTEALVSREILDRMVEEINRLRTTKYSEDDMREAYEIGFGAADCGEPNDFDGWLEERGTPSKPQRKDML